MESTELLDILGNKNRRRILQLLSEKPCYVTEISDYLGVSPKAVIDHLQILEDAGLIESRIDERRRKYFYITRNLRMEINVSPYSFGIKSAYPRPNFKTNYEYLKIEHQVNKIDNEDINDLIDKIEKLEKIENELSIAQRQIQSQITEVMKHIEDIVEEIINSGSENHNIDELKDESLPLRRMAQRMGISEEVIEEKIRELEEKEVIEE